MGGCGGWECLSKTFFKIEVERREKIGGYVTRGGESEHGIGVRVALGVGVPE